MPVALRRFVFSTLSLWTAVGLFGIYFVMHLSRYVNFGIDLVGGTYITLEVEMDRVLDMELHERIMKVIAGSPAEQEGTLSVSSQGLQKTVVLTCADEQQALTVEASPRIAEQRLLVVRSGATLTCSLSEQEIVQLTRAAVANNIQVLHSRIDQFGVGEVAIVAQGDKQIVVELPHVHDVRKAKSIIGTAALLEVKPVLDSGRTEDEILGRMGGEIPDGLLIAYNKDRKSCFLIPRYAELTGKLLKTAWANPSGGALGVEPVVNFQFTPEGGEKFYAMTSRTKNPLIAILIDGVVITAAHAQQPLHSEGYISGNFTFEYAQELASMLRSGAYVAPVRFVEDRTIGPSLGAESIHRGLISCGIGIVLLFIFSVFVYRIAGILAFIVLLFNLLGILFMLALLGATLTLPGIAGMVLTLGMAIDASVLIYERIREELAGGASFVVAVESGFSGALAVILDANITTFVAAAVLYFLIGSGPIRGFAITMMIGIISTLITGLILLKSLFRYCIEGLSVRSLRL